MVQYATLEQRRIHRLPYGICRMNEKLNERARHALGGAAHGSSARLQSREVGTLVPSMGSMKVQVFSYE